MSNQNILENSFICSHCKKGCKTSQGHICSKTFMCDICCKMLASKNFLEKHKKIHFSQTYECHMCNMLLKSDKSLEIHKRTHDKFPCLLCANIFTRKTDLKIHMLIHMDERHFACTLCAKRFSTKPSLSKHRRSHNQDAFNCSVCSKSFSTITLLNLHLRIHTDKKGYECTQCEKDFKQSAHLKTHGHACWVEAFFV